MTPVALDLFPPAIGSVSDNAVSEGPKVVRELLRRLESHQSRPISTAKTLALREQLAEIVRECSREHWDGYDARPVLPEAFVESQLLIRILPRSVRVPEIVPEPSGSLGFEWHDDRGSAFVVSLAGKGKISYAAILPGGTRRYGAERFSMELPTVVREILLTHFQETRS